MLVPEVVPSLVLRWFKACGDSAKDCCHRSCGDYFTVRSGMANLKVSADNPCEPVGLMTVAYVFEFILLLVFGWASVLLWDVILALGWIADLVLATTVSTVISVGLGLSFFRDPKKRGFLARWPVASFSGVLAVGLFQSRTFPKGSSALGVLLLMASSGLPMLAAGLALIRIGVHRADSVVSLVLLLLHVPIYEHSYELATLGRHGEVALLEAHLKAEGEYLIAHPSSELENPPTGTPMLLREGSGQRVAVAWLQTRWILHSYGPVYDPEGLLENRDARMAGKSASAWNCGPLIEEWRWCEIG